MLNMPTVNSLIIKNGVMLTILTKKKCGQPQENIACRATSSSAAFKLSELAKGGFKNDIYVDIQNPIFLYTFLKYMHPEIIIQ